MTRRLDIVEAITNAAVGFAVSWGITFYALPPLFGIVPSGKEAVQITALFFSISTLRAYVLRRVFRKIH